MMRQVCHYREPICDPNQITKNLEIDLLELSAAAAKETLLTGVHMRGWLMLFNEVLVPKDKWLRWQDGGLGVGRELKRSFSNIFGRFLARYYLQKEENVLNLLPIEGDDFLFSPNMRIRKRSKVKGDMPDWIGWTPQGLVVAEAKGSHDPGNWGNQIDSSPRRPPTVKTASDQVAKVEILRKINKSSSEQSIQFKSWVVASRWATKDNNLDPWLFTIDPDSPGVELEPREFRAAVSSLQQTLNRKLVEAMGFACDDYHNSIFLPDIEHLERGIHALAGPMGFIPVRQSSELVALRTFFRGIPLSLVSLSERVLSVDMEVYATEPRRFPSGFSRAGFSVHHLTQDGSHL